MPDESLNGVALVSPRDMYPVYLKLITLFGFNPFSVSEVYDRLGGELGLKTISECLSLLVEMGFLKSVPPDLFEAISLSSLPNELILGLNG